MMIREKEKSGWMGQQFPFVIIRFVGSMDAYACYNTKAEK